MNTSGEGTRSGFVPEKSGTALRLSLLAVCQLKCFEYFFHQDEEVPFYPSVLRFIKIKY